MLVLTRKRNESIIIGSGADAVEVRICKLGGNVVRLGIVAPKDVRIVRNELEARDRRDDKAA